METLVKTALPSPAIEAETKSIPDQVTEILRKTKEIPDAFKNFNSLPDEAFVRLPVVVLLDASSPATVWRKAKKGTFPAPVKLGEKSTGWNVGSLRRHYAALTARSAS
jgi:predicted DNA-binding transcriptional regulator AlpA